MDEIKQLNVQISLYLIRIVIKLNLNFLQINILENSFQSLADFLLSSDSDTIDAFLPIFTKSSTADSISI